MKFINEDYIDAIDNEDIVSQDNEGSARHGSSGDITYKYQFVLYFTTQNYRIETIDELYDFYNTDILNLYKYFRRNICIEEYSEVKLYSGLDITWDCPNDFEKYMTDKDEYSMKFNSLSLIFAINANFTVYRYLQLLSNLPKVVHRLAAVKIFSEYGKESYINSIIPIAHAFGKTINDKMNWYGNNENGYKRRSELYTAVFNLLGTTVRNYNAVNRELPLDIPEYIFEYLIKNYATATNIKRPTIKKDIDRKLENFSIDLEKFLSPDDIGEIALWNVTNIHIKNVAITQSGKPNSKLIADALRKQFPDGKVPVKIHDIFMHNVKYSYGRFVTGLFYIGPLKYSTPKDEEAIGEVFLTLNLYDARQSTFWQTLKDITYDVLTDNDVE